MILFIPDFVQMVVDSDWRLGVHLVQKVDSQPVRSLRSISKPDRRQSAPRKVRARAITGDGTLYIENADGSFSKDTSTLPTLGTDVQEALQLLNDAVESGDELAILEAIMLLEQTLNIELPDNTPFTPGNYPEAVAWRHIYSADMQMQIAYDSYRTLAFNAALAESYGIDSPETRLLYPYAALKLGVISTSLYDHVQANFLNIPLSQREGVDLIASPSTSQELHSNSLQMASAAIIYEYEGKSPLVVNAVLASMLSIKNNCRYALLHRAIMRKSQGLHTSALADLNLIIANSTSQEMRLARVLREAWLNQSP